MSQENCSQEKRFKPNDDLYANLYSNVMSNLPRQSKRRSSILKTIDGNLGMAEDRRASRRVSFANNLFLQEVKPDGTTQLITEPFKNLSDDRIDVQHPPTDPQQPDGNDSFELQPPVIKSDKRKKSSKSLRSYLSSHYNLQNDVDYATVFNTSVNRTNAKRKFEETQRQDLNTLFCDDDMELTRMDKENNASKFNFSSAFSSNSNMNLTFVTSKENSVSPSSFTYPVPKGFVTAASNSNMDLTNLSAANMSTTNMSTANMSTTNMSTFLTASASKNRSRSFVDKENACVTRSKSRQSAAHQESLLALNSSNINKENETMIGAEDMSTTLNQTTLNQTTLNQTATLNQTTATSSQPANRTQMFTSASMDLTRCEAPSSGKTCVYSSPDDMELTEMAEASRTNVTSAAATTFRSEMSLTNLSSATAAYPNFSLANTASQSSQEIEQPNKTADLANFSQDTSIVQFPIRNPKLNHNFTGYSKLNQTFSSEMDLTNLGRTVDQSIVAAAAGATKSTCMFGDDDMELTDLEASKSNESSKNLSSLNEMNTTSNVIHYTSSSSSQEQTGSSSSGSKTLEQDSSVHFPVKNPELNNVSICKEPVVTVEVSAFGDQENVPASSNPESDKTAKSDKTVENSQTINMSTASIANATEAQRSSSKTQMFTSASMDLTRMTGSQETVQASSNCVKTQMFTSASMDLTRMTGTQETVQPSLNCVKTQMFTSASMDLTRITGAEEAVQQTEQTEENDQFTSEMELTNLERSNLERSNLETSNLERTNLNSSNRSESNEGRHTLASQNTRVYSQNDMDLTELKNDATRNPTMASRMELTELTSAVELNATAPSQDQSLNKAADLSAREEAENVSVAENGQVNETADQVIETVDQQVDVPADQTNDKTMDMSQTSQTEVRPAEEDCVKTQMFTSASMDLTRMTGTQEAVQPTSNGTKTQMFTSASMDLTRMTGAEEETHNTIAADEQKDGGDGQSLSEMELTNLDQSNLDASKTLVEEEAENEDRQTAASEHTRMCSPENDDMDLTDMNIESELSKCPTKSQMDLTNLTSIVNLTAAANLTSTANLTSAINPATELNTTANLMSTTTTRVLNSKCATKLNTNSLKSSFSAASRRFSTNNAWAIKKDKIHSTINFKNQSLFKQTDLTAFEELATPQRPAFANKTLPIHLPMNVQTPLFNRAAVNATANTTANATANATAVDEVMTDAMTAHTMVAEKVIADATTVEAATADATTADATTVDATPVNATTVDATEIADAQNLEIDKSMNQTNANESVSKDAEPEKDQTVGEKSIQQNDKTVGDLQEKTVVDDQKTLVDEERTVIDDQKTIVNDQQTIVDDQKTAIDGQKTIVDDQQTLVNDQQTLTDPEKTVMDDEKIVVDESNESRELMCRAKDPSMFGLEMSGNQLSIKEHLIYEKTEVTMNDSQDQSEIVQSMRVDEEQSQKNEQSMENMNEQSMENMNQQSMEIVNNQSMAKSVQNLSVAKSVQNESVVRPAFSADQTANKSLNRSAAIRPNVSQSMKSVHESPYKLANLSQQRTLPAANKTLERTLLEKSAPEIRVTNTELMDEPMEITRTADDSRQQQLLNNSRDIVLDEQGSAYATVNSNQTIDEMLNAIKVNISNRLKEHSRLTSNASQLGAFLEATNRNLSTLIEVDSEANTKHLSPAIVEQRPPINDKTFNRTFNRTFNKTFDKTFDKTFSKQANAQPNNKTFDISKSESPAHLQATFTVNQTFGVKNSTYLLPREANSTMTSPTGDLVPTHNNQTYIVQPDLVEDPVQPDPIQDAKNLIENAAEFLDEKSSSLNDFKLSQSIDRNSQSSSPTSFTPNSSAKINSIVQKLNSMEKPANSTFVQTKRAEETSNLSVCIGNRSNLVQSEMEVQETQEVQEIQKVQEREKEASVQQNKQEAVSVQELEKEASIQLHDKEALIQDPIQASIQDSIQASVQASVRQQEVSVQEREQELSARAGPSRRLSLFQNLSNLERELNRDTMNDSVLAFQTQTEFERTPSTTATEHFDANNYQMECDEERPPTENTNYQINQLEEQRRLVEQLIGEKSFFTDFMEDAQMQDDEKLKDYFSQQNKTAISLKAFNGQIAVALELENQEETEYSTVRDMRLVFDFDKPALKLWSDKFYLFYADRPEDRNFIEILKIVLTTRFDRLKADLLQRYNTTDYLVEIEKEVELMLNRVADFAKDIRITCLKFIRHEFKIKQDHTFDFCVNLFGLSSKRFSVILNVNYAAEDFLVKPRFNCWYDEKRFYPFDNIKAIVEELNREPELKMNKIVSRVNGFIRKLRSSFLEQSVRTALKNWDS